MIGFGEKWLTPPDCRKARSLATPARRIEIEAFLHDGANGALLDRKTFAASVTGDVVLSDSPPLGSPLFYQTDFGRTWGGLLNNIALWTEAKVSCLPFIARVVKITGHQIVIYSGTNSGFSAGDAINLLGWRKSGTTSVEGVHPGTGNQLHTTASLVFVYPTISVLEMAEKPETMSKIQAGDLLVIQ